VFDDSENLFDYKLDNMKEDDLRQTILAENINKSHAASLEQLHSVQVPHHQHMSSVDSNLMLKLSKVPKNVLAAIKRSDDYILKLVSNNVHSKTQCVQKQAKFYS